MSVGNAAVKNVQGLPNHGWTLASGKGRERMRPILKAASVALAEKPKLSQKDKDAWRLLEENIKRENHSC